MFFLSQIRPVFALYSENSNSWSYFRLSYGYNRQILYRTLSQRPCRRFSPPHKTISRPPAGTSGRPIKKPGFGRRDRTGNYGSCLFRSWKIKETKFLFRMAVGHSSPRNKRAATAKSAKNPHRRSNVRKQKRHGTFARSRPRKSRCRPVAPLPGRCTAAILRRLLM